MESSRKTVTPVRLTLRDRGRGVAGGGRGGDLTLALLDGFRLERDGYALQLPLGVQRLVAFLAIHNRPLQRLFVAGNLWIDSDEDHANANLRTALWRLRSLGAQVVESTRSHVRLVPGLSVDLHDCSSRARGLLRRETSPGARDRAMPQDAVKFTGDLLPDWYDDWVLLERERFRQLRLHALESLCESLAGAGEYGAAVDAGMACIAAEPLRESAHRTLIGVHLAAGNRNEALREYRLYCTLMRNELGLGPSARMECVARSLATGEALVEGAPPSMSDAQVTQAH
jgi:DNA-binding SARP family transcriptional activator